MLRTIRIFCVAAVLLSAIQLFRIDAEQKRAQASFQELRGHVQQEELTETAGNGVNPGFAELLQRNGDFIGWLTIEDTRIDYPVMHTPQEPEFYLRRNFEGESEISGVPFMDGACDLQESENFIIYGHNMRDGSMFADLAKFTKAEFCEQHPLITFDTVNGKTLWQAVTVFKIAARDTREFPYHRVTDFSSKTQTAEDYLARCRYYAIWDDTAALDEDVKLLTLSTCEYSLTNGRLVVVAKQIG